MDEEDDSFDAVSYLVLVGLSRGEGVNDVGRRGKEVVYQFGYCGGQRLHSLRRSIRLLYGVGHIRDGVGVGG